MMGLQWNYELDLLLDLKIFNCLIKWIELEEFSINLSLYSLQVFKNVNLCLKTLKN